jgi:hypothetical protein
LSPKFQSHARRDQLVDGVARDGLVLARCADRTASFGIQTTCFAVESVCTISSNASNFWVPERAG